MDRRGFMQSLLACSAGSGMIGLCESSIKSPVPVHIGIKEYYKSGVLDTWYRDFISYDGNAVVFPDGDCSCSNFALVSRLSDRRSVDFTLKECNPNKELNGLDRVLLYTSTNYLGFTIFSSMPGNDIPMNKGLAIVPRERFAFAGRAIFQSLTPAYPVLDGLKSMHDRYRTVKSICSGLSE